MKTLQTACMAITLFAFAGATPWSAMAQTVPADLDVVAVAGGLGSLGGHAIVHIAASGQGHYRRYPSNDLASAVDSASFNVSLNELEQLWGVIQSSNFFYLDAEYADSETIDGTFARLAVVAGGDTHRVSTRNIAVEGFDAVVSLIDELVPGDDVLLYNTDPPDSFTPLDVCQQVGKRLTASPFDALSKRVESDLQSSHLSSTFSAVAALPHPGSAVGYYMSLREAVDRGIVTLSAKGQAYGDQVSISIDNSGNEENDRLSLKLYLEFWGPGASVGTALEIEAAIESVWGGKTTSDGKLLDVDVVTRTSTGGETPPGTLGYHQIKLVTDTTIASHVAGLGTDFDLNDGVGSGTWETTGKRTAHTWTHEAGHLLGLDDRYEEYNKQSDGNWLRESDGESVTTLDLAATLEPLWPEHDLHEIIRRLEDGRQRMTHPQVGFEDDLMAWEKGDVIQEDIDWLAEQAGAFVVVEPGDSFVTEDHDFQSFAVIRGEEVFAAPGQVKVLGGLWVSCIDRLKLPPDSGAPLDVAPPLEEWNGIESAGLLQQLLEHIDANEDYCRRFPNIPRNAIWRISDNLLLSYECRLCYRAETDAYLEEAGLSLGDRLLDFPRMTNPGGTDSSTALVLPQQLFRFAVDASPGTFVEPGEVVSLDGIVYAPNSWEGVSAISWSLETPGGSTSTLSNEADETTVFAPDIRGFYQVHGQAEVVIPTDTLHFEVAAPITAADDDTETFESGTLESAGPFYWTSTGGAWFVTDTDRYTGTYSAASPEIETGDSTAISVRFHQTSEAPISFAIKLRSDPYDQFTFAVDGDVLLNLDRHVLIPSEFFWRTFTANLPPGEHVATWTFYQRSGLVGMIGEPDRAWIDDVFFPQSAVFVGIDGSDDTIPTRYTLSQNYPNPFNPTTTISYALPLAADATLTVYDVLGRTVRELAPGTQPAGTYEVLFDATGLPSGVYFYRLQAGDYVETRRMVVVK